MVEMWFSEMSFAENTVDISFYNCEFYNLPIFKNA